jgi:hypothetical protein
MTRKRIPLYKSIVNGNITLWERRLSSTLITSLCSSYEHRRNCRTIAIISGPPNCNNSISTSSIRQGSQIVSLTTSVDLPWLHSPLCSIPVDMRYLSGPQLYKKDLEFSTTYQLLGTSTTVTYFHIQDGLLCHMGHICVLTSECANMIWEAHYSRMAGHFGVEKTMVVLQKHFYWPKL